MNFFYILSGPLGYVMEWIYKLLPSYGWDIIIFTLLINIVKIPLQLSQQKSMAKMSAFQPMMMEIQTKYKDKPEKQQEEMLKLQQNYGYNPTAGCVPMLLNFLVMFGVIGVVYNPLERIFHISAAALTAAGEALTASGVAFTAITRDTNIIAQVVAGNGGVLGCFSAEQIATITEFSQHMNFLGIDLTRIPKLGLSLDIVLPLLSVITMLLSTHISMKASGQQMQGSMKLTMYMMPLMYLFFCFTYPLAFSLYYVISNIVMTVQTQVMRKVYDPDKMRKEIEAQIAEKKKQEKRGVKNTTVKVTDPKTGKTTEKNLSASEMNKRRLEYARQLDEERYKDERTVPLMYLFFCFTYPLAFSLYYVISNIVMTVQTQVMRKVYDPDKMRKEIEAQIAEKKKQEKRGVKNTTVKVTDPKTGKTTEKNLSASEMNKRRLEYARQLDEERYKDERTVPLSELNKQDKE